LTIIRISGTMAPMYVCICNGHKDRDIREAAASGMRCARAIYAHLGKPPRCGRCLDLASKLIEEVHAGRGEECAVAAERAA
jgi:bacterioferritin-associated ferredoxin